MSSLSGMSLIADLRAAGAALTGDDVPASTELQQVVGAIVKTLEHAGVTVAEDLLPKPVDDAVAPAAAAAEPAAAAAATDALAELVARAEAAVNALEHKAVTVGAAVPVSPPSESTP